MNSIKDYIYDVLPNDRFMTKNELHDITGLNDRAIRRAIAEIRKEHSVISLSCMNGYRKSKPIDEMSNEEIEEEIGLISHQINEGKSRIKCLKKNMRKQVARIEILKKAL